MLSNSLALKEAIKQVAARSLVVCAGASDGAQAKNGANNFFRTSAWEWFTLRHVWLSLAGWLAFSHLWVGGAVLWWLTLRGVARKSAVVLTRHTFWLVWSVFTSFFTSGGVSHTLRVAVVFTVVEGKVGFCGVVTGSSVLVSNSYRVAVCVNGGGSAVVKGESTTLQHSTVCTVTSCGKGELSAAVGNLFCNKLGAVNTGFGFSATCTGLVHSARVSLLVPPFTLK